MKLVFTPSPSKVHKYRVLFPDKRAIDFGSYKLKDYTDHKNPLLMRTHLIRCGGNMTEEQRLETDSMEIHRCMLNVSTSSTEDWENIYKRGYWERWILWSHPTVNQAKLHMTQRSGILFMPLRDTFY